MRDDLSLSQSSFGLAAGVFFLSYCAAQVPTCALVSKLGARREIRRQPLPRRPPPPPLLHRHSQARARRDDACVGALLRRHCPCADERAAAAAPLPAGLPGGGVLPRRHPHALALVPRHVPLPRVDPLHPLCHARALDVEPPTPGAASDTFQPLPRKRLPPQPAHRAARPAPQSRTRLPAWSRSGEIWGESPHRAPEPVLTALVPRFSPLQARHVHRRQLLGRAPPVARRRPRPRRLALALPRAGARSDRR